MAITVNADRAKSMVAKAIRAALVPMLVGSPGVGKSAVVHQLAEEYQLKVIDLRLSQCDPTDLLGFPSINKESGRAYYAPMDTFPLEGDAVPDGYNGWLLFLDEFNSADRDVQKAAYKLVLDRQVGLWRLHRKVAMVCAGNLDTDNAIVEEMSTALQSRLIHMEMMVDPEQWVDWATRNDVDYRITSYIQFDPGQLQTFKPDHADRTYASPRTWEFASRLISQEGIDGPDILPLLAGTVSEGVARQFLGFTRIYKDLPTMAQIKANPAGILVPEEPSVLFALTGALAHNAREDNLPSLMKFTERLPKEFQVVCLRETVRRNRELLSHESIRDWITHNATELF